MAHWSIGIYVIPSMASPTGPSWCPFPALFDMCSLPQLSSWGGCLYPYGYLCVGTPVLLQIPVSRCGPLLCFPVGLPSALSLAGDHSSQWDFPADSDVLPTWGPVYILVIQPTQRATSAQICKLRTFASKHIPFCYGVWENLSWNWVLTVLDTIPSSPIY